MFQEILSNFFLAQNSKFFGSHKKVHEKTNFLFPNSWLFADLIWSGEGGWEGQLVKVPPPPRWKTPVKTLSSLLLRTWSVITETNLIWMSLNGKWLVDGKHLEEEGQLSCNGEAFEYFLTWNRQNKNKCFGKQHMKLDIDPLIKLNWFNLSD